jgi:Subtilase family
MSNYKCEISTMTAMDPRLQRRIVLQSDRVAVLAASLSARSKSAKSARAGRKSDSGAKRSGATKSAASATGSTDVELVSVIAKVSNLSAWQREVGMSGVVIGQASARTAGTLVTGRVRIDALGALRAKSFVKSLKAAQKVRRSLAATTLETQSRPNQWPMGNATNGGKGVLVGVVDFGCDFAHLNLRKANGATRLLGIWDQSGTLSNHPFGYGTVFTPTKINAANRATKPYTALGYGPDPSEPAHGTHVTDTAAGNGLGSGVPGVAPKSDILFVELASSDIAWGGPESVGQSFGDSVQLLEAVKYIFDRAGSKPCVVNLSLGTNGGPHDGTTLVEQGFDRLLNQAPNRAIVLAASNSRDDGIHAQSSVPANGRFDLIIQTVANDVTETEIELWYGGVSRLTVEVIAPDGQSLGAIDPGETGTVRGANNKPVVFVSNRLNDPNNHDNQIGVWMAPRTAAGQWKLRLTNTGTSAVSFHAWIERDDRGQAQFVSGMTPSFTIGSIACGHDTFAVASYDAHAPDQPISWFSSEGPTRDGRNKPELAAPGHLVMAAESRSKTGVAKMSGTSMASPAVSGLVALVLAQAKAQGRNLSVAQTRAVVMDSARRAPPAGGSWDSRYGVGRIHGRGAIAKVMGVVAPPLAGEPIPIAALKESRKTSTKKVAKKSVKKVSGKSAPEGSKKQAATAAKTALKKSSNIGMK